MTKRADILDKSEIYRQDGSLKAYGLVYTEKCGWVDLGHANPNGRGLEGAVTLWKKINSGTKLFQCALDQTPLKVSYSQSMGWHGIRDAVTKHYEVQRELSSLSEQEGIALAIFMDVSIAFEALQSNWFYRHLTDSGYSAEDLVSNLIGFYRALRPGFDFSGVCKPVSKDQAFAIWDAYGGVGVNKNKELNPILFPNPQVQSGLPYKGKLPPELDTIRPAVIGQKFKEIK